MSRYGAMHTCVEYEDLEAEENEIRLDLESLPKTHFYGCAITDITQDALDGRWYAHNGEYCTLVAYCPFCGVRLPAMRGGNS